MHNLPPPAEKLAFQILIEGDINFPEIYTEPLDTIIQALSSNKDIQQVADHLPDVDLQNTKI